MMTSSVISRNTTDALPTLPASRHYSTRELRVESSSPSSSSNKLLSSEAEDEAEGDFVRSLLSMFKMGLSHNKSKHKKDKQRRHTGVLLKAAHQSQSTPAKLATMSTSMTSSTPKKKTPNNNNESPHKPSTGNQRRRELLLRSHGRPPAPGRSISSRHNKSVSFREDRNLVQVHPVADLSRESCGDLYYTVHELEQMQQDKLEEERTEALQEKERLHQQRQAEKLARKKQRRARLQAKLEARLKGRQRQEPQSESCLASKVEDASDNPLEGSLSVLDLDDLAMNNLRETGCPPMNGNASMPVLHSNGSRRGVDVLPRSPSLLNTTPKPAIRKEDVPPSTYQNSGAETADGRIVVSEGTQPHHRHSPANSNDTGPVREIVVNPIPSEPQVQSANPPELLSTPNKSKQDNQENNTLTTSSTKWTPPTSLFVPPSFCNPPAPLDHNRPSTSGNIPRNVHSRRPMDKALSLHSIKLNERAGGLELVGSSSCRSLLTQFSDIEKEDPYGDFWTMIFGTSK